MLCTGWPSPTRCETPSGPKRVSGGTPRAWNSVTPKSSGETGRLWVEDGGFGVGEFLVAAVVAAVFDELFGSGKIGGRRIPRILLISDL